jgi:ribosomal protein S27AE
MLDGCQGKPRTPTIIEKVCPQCGELIEMFSIDSQMACEKCGFIAYNDTLSCVQWCAHARKCVGDEMYEYMMAIVEAQKAQRKKEECA